jgi:hypothetical protein
MNLTQNHRRPPPANSGSMAGSIASALALIDRVRQTLVAESEEVARHCRVDYEAYSWRKAQGLLELNRMAPILGCAKDNPILHAALLDLTAVLAENQRILEIQLKAAKAVANIVAHAIREGQSDGTYSAMAWGGRDG